MCLIIFSWQPDAQNPLVLVANRDEFYDRPTAPVQFWEDYPEIFGGRDKKAWGSWLALSRSGRFAAVTNYRQWPAPEGEISRGQLVKDCLNSSLSTHAFIKNVQKNAHRYSGFNFLAGSINELYYYSNIEGVAKKLEPGVYGLCNKLLNSPWPKLEKTRDAVAKALNNDNFAEPETLLHIMQDTTRFPDHLLPDTGIGRERERLLSSAFINSPDYGTRNTSVLMFNRNKAASWHEQTYGTEGCHLEWKHFFIDFE
ncbi:NRDE family protein [Endozoicomonas euniceicola]|uniref:NRDE family protein n=1 Tax=Endozoicomonas euniceicola TaxID=1234143 RepID=A0ABY6H0U7_9GAMM|nr:NRDE family protein [Endozoicomonas euniceicola]UYM18685.1 NRDE family protein [Endozoicomonas euniceicola]